MSYTFTRQALYELVWGEPIQSLAKKFGLSDRGLAKICAAANIPVPARGYWAKLQAGHKVEPCLLPARGLGQSFLVHIGERTWDRSAEDARILSESIPPPPVFEPDMETVQQQASALVRKAPLPIRGAVDWHPELAKLLAIDEARERKKLASPYPSFTDGAVLNAIFEKRRLKILNALFICLTRCGMHPSISGKQGRELSVAVGNTYVPLTLDGIGAAKQIERERQGYAFMARNDKDKLRLAISRSWSGGTGPMWEDKPGSPLERQLRDVAAAIIVFGEQCIRQGAMYAHSSRIKRKAELEEEVRNRKAEEERRQRELQAKREQARVDHLLTQARSLENADRIRGYVSRVHDVNSTAATPITVAELQEWSSWALAEADRIDPVVSGAFRTRPEE